MRSIIKEITPGSIAEEVGIEKNDILISINGRSKGYNRLQISFR